MKPTCMYTIINDKYLAICFTYWNFFASYITACSAESSNNNEKLFYYMQVLTLNESKKIYGHKFLDIGVVIC